MKKEPVKKSKVVKKPVKPRSTIKKKSKESLVNEIIATIEKPEPELQDEWPIEELREALNPRQRRFAELYLGECMGNGTQSYLKAYICIDPKHASVSANALLKLDKMKKYLAVRGKQILDALDMTPEWVLSNIKTVIERGLNVEPVLGSDGTPTGEFKFDPSSVLRGCELVGKKHAMWTDKQIQDTGENLTNFLTKISDSVASNPMRMLQEKYLKNDKDAGDSGES